MTSSLASMTGFSRADGVAGAATWTWELRSVNGRGLDLRFKLPSGFDRLEPALREAASRHIKRGNVQANLGIKREIESRLVVDPQALADVLALALNLHAQIPGSAPPRAETLLSLPGVLRTAGLAETDAVDTGSLDTALLAGFTHALEQLVHARRGEGARLHALLAGQLAEVEALRARAAAEAADQPASQRARMMESVQALLRDSPGLTEERIAQEVALLASRSDVREELDRLESHVVAAHTLLAEGAAVGRRLDFLVQEFNREANTLCSKSASAALTATGLRLKAAIEQLREQVQNIE